MKPLAISASIVVILISLGDLMASTYYVSPEFSGESDGSRKRPYTSLSDVSERLMPGDRCVLQSGVYRETLRPTRSGTAEQPITYTGVGGKVTLTGCDVVMGWTEVEPGHFSAPVDMQQDWQQQVYVDGKMLWLARWPSAPQGSLLSFPTATMKSGSAKGVIVDSDLPPGDFRGALVWASSHKRWYNWTAPIQNRQGDQLTFPDHTDLRNNHQPKAGGKYVIIGAEACFDAQWEWFYKAATGTLHIRLPKSYGGAMTVELKRRETVIDLRGLSHIRVERIDIHAATIVTDEHSSDCKFDRMRITFPSHSWIAYDQYGSQKHSTGIQLRGTNHELINSEIAFSSGNGVLVSGSNIRIINCWIHDVNTLGTYCSAIELGFCPTQNGSIHNVPSRGTLISHCTLERCGRSLIGLSGFYDSLIQFCDLHHAGYLTDDLGLVYGNCINGGGSEFRYNYLHDNLSEHCNAGLYYDHGCKNILSHHNVVWNIKDNALQNNQSAMFLLWYHNTGQAKRNGYASAWAAAQPKQLWGSELRNNYLDGVIHVKANPGELLQDGNVMAKIAFDATGIPAPSGIASKATIPGLIGPVDVPTVGARHTDQPWVVGHDFDNPPTVDARRSTPPARNRLINASFESGSLDPWRWEGGARQHYQTNTRSQWTIDEPARMGSFSAMFPEAGAQISQCVDDLEPGIRWTLIVHLNLSEDTTARVALVTPENAVIAERIICWQPTKQGEAWRPIELNAMIAGTSVCVVISHVEGQGTIYVDDLGLAPSRVGIESE